MTPLKRIIPLNNFDKIFANIEVGMNTY